LRPHGLGLPFAASPVPRHSISGQAVRADRSPAPTY